MRPEHLTEGEDYLMGVRFLGVHEGRRRFALLSPTGKVMETCVIYLPEGENTSFCFEPARFLKGADAEAQTKWWLTSVCVDYFIQETGRAKMDYGAVYHLLRRHGVPNCKNSRGQCLWDVDAVKKCLKHVRKNDYADSHLVVDSKIDGFLSINELHEKYGFNVRWMQTEAGKFNVKAYKHGNRFILHEADTVELANWVSPITLKRRCPSKSLRAEIRRDTKGREYPILLSTEPLHRRVYAPQYSLAFDK